MNDMKTKGPGYVAPSEQQYREFKTPDKSLYKDINLDTVLPKVSNEMVRAHGAAHNFLDFEQVMKDCNEQNLHILRSHVDLGVTYIFGQCLASMKARFYNLDIVLNGKYISKLYFRSV